MNKNFSTFDLNLATTLVTIGYKLEKLDKTDPKKVRFVFKEEKELINLVESFWKEELKIEPQKYFNNLRAIKSRLYSEK